MMWVYIPSRDREELLAQTLPAWMALDANVRIVVAEEDTDAYMAELLAVVPKLIRNPAENRCKIELITLDPIISGMGAIRQQCVNHAVASGLDSIIMSDDDIYPHKSSDLEDVAANVSHDFVLGLGCVVSQHDLLLGDQAWRVRVPNGDPVFCASGYGFRMFALNLQSVQAIGGFDPELDVCFEDAELMRQGVANGLTWWLDPSLRANPLGKRFAPGGIATLAGSAEERATRTEACHRRVHELWPGYMSRPGVAPRFAWKRLIDDCMPGWRTSQEWELWATHWYAFEGTLEFLETDHDPSTWRSNQC